MLRTPREKFWSLSNRPGFLRLKLRSEKITDQLNPSFVGRRQQHINFTACTSIDFVPATEGEAAGITLIQSNDYNLRVEYSLYENKKAIRLIRCFAGEETVLSYKEFDGEHLYLKVTAKGQDYSFYYGTDEKEMKVLVENVDGSLLSTDVAGGFVGTYIGMFASSNDSASTNHADFDWFEYRGL